MNCSSQFHATISKTVNDRFNIFGYHLNILFKKIIESSYILAHQWNYSKIMFKKNHFSLSKKKLINETTEI